MILVRAEDHSTVGDKDGNAEVDEDEVNEAKADRDEDEASEVDEERDESAELDDEADDKDQEEGRVTNCRSSKLEDEEVGGAEPCNTR